MVGFAFTVVVFIVLLIQLGIRYSKAYLLGYQLFFWYDSGMVCIE